MNGLEGMLRSWRRHESFKPRHRSRDNRNWERKGHKSKHVINRYAYTPAIRWGGRVHQAELAQLFQFYYEISIDEYNLSGTNDFLKALDFPHEDITRMELAYSDRLSYGDQKPADLVKKAIELHWTAYRNRNSKVNSPCDIPQSELPKVRAELIATMEVLRATYRIDGGHKLETIIQDGGEVLKAAERSYDEIILLATHLQTGFSRNPNAIVNLRPEGFPVRNLEIALGSAIYLIEKYILGWRVSPNPVSLIDMGSRYGKVPFSQ